MTSMCDSRASLPLGRATSQASLPHHRSSGHIQLPGPNGCQQPSKTSPPELISYLAREIEMAAKSNRMKRKNMAFYRIVVGGNVTVVKEVLQHLQVNGLHDELAWVLGTKTGSSHTADPSTFRKAVNITFYVLTAIIFFLLSPVFYIFHATANSLYWKYRNNLVNSIRLPLVFAVTSGKREMIQLFLDFGCHITTQDENSNNIFHYLAGLSQENPKNIIKGHEELCACFSDNCLIKFALMKQKNQQMLSGLEAVCKYGSPRYFRYLTENSDCLGTNSLEVGPDKVCLTTEEGQLSFSNSDTFSVDDSRLGLCSSETKVDMKVTQFDMSSYEHGRGYFWQSYLVQIFCSRPVEIMSEEDVLAIKNAVVMHKWMNKKTRQAFVFSVFGNLLCLLVTILLLVQLVIHRGDGNRFPHAQIFMEDLMGNFKKTFGNTTLIYFLHPDFDFEGIYNRTLDMNMESFVTKCHKISEDTDPTEIRERASQGLFTGDVDRVDKNSLVIKYTVEVLVASQVLLDLIYRQNFLWYNFNFRAPSILQTIIPVTQRWFPGSYVEKQLLMLMSFLYGSLLLIEMKQKSILKKFDNALENTLSGINFQEMGLNGSVANLMISVFTPMKNLMSEYLDREAIWGIIFMICLLLRFLHTVHIFRLFPGTGFYVITTKKMCKHLTQFAFFFFLVIASFAAIFHFVMRDPDCPVVKRRPFSTFSLSLFTTYTVGLGNDSYDFSGNVSGQLVYLVCTIFIIVMLLNLIVAVMTTTATALNTSPWKESMCEVEFWNEILGTEAQVLTLLSPLRYLRNKICKRQSQHLEDDNTYEVIHLVTVDQ